MRSILLSVFKQNTTLTQDALLLVSATCQYVIGTFCMLSKATFMIHKGSRMSQVCMTCSALPGVGVGSLSGDRSGRGNRGGIRSDPSTNDLIPKPPKTNKLPSQPQSRVPSLGSSTPGRKPEAMEKGNCSWEGREKKPNRVPCSFHACSIQHSLSWPWGGPGRPSIPLPSTPAGPGLKLYLIRHMLYPSTGFL